MTEYRVTARAVCKCGTTEVHGVVIFKMIANSKPPTGSLTETTIPRAICPICSGPADIPLRQS